MFEKMVLSGAGRRDRRLSKFFVGSTLAYLVLAGSALAVSICISDPKLVGTGGNTKVGISIFQPSGGGHPAASRPTTSPRQNLNSPRPLEYIISHSHEAAAPPVLRTPFFDSTESPGPVGEGGGGGGGHDPFGGINTDGPSAGDQPPMPHASNRVSQPAEVQHPRDTGPVRVSQPVLQGKATFRKTPEYPALARLVKKEGSVVVEVVISPEGRVESARAVSGDPLLAPTAVAAALEWKFQPTYLGNVPVRVAGAITFVFKLGQ